MAKISLSVLLLLSLSGRPAFSQAMGYDPDLWLPDTIFLALGNSIEIYNDNVAFIKLNDSLVSFKWTHEQGMSDGKKFYWTADHTGKFALKITCFYLNEAVDSAATILKVVTKSTSASGNLLAIGNSLTEWGYIYQFPQMLLDLNFQVNPIGTMGDIYKHEGHSGWMFSTFLSNTSPFYFRDAISFSTYVTYNLLPDPDIIRISLGINDCVQNYPQNEIVSNATKLIDTIHRDYPDALIIVAIPTLCESSGAGWIAEFGNLSNFEPYILRLRELWKRLYTKFGYGRSNPKIQVSFDGLFIDRSNGYPLTDGLHPNPTGYSQLIRGFTNVLNYYIKDPLINDIGQPEADRPFKIFPSPAKDNFVIVFSDILPGFIQLYNSLGQKMISQTVTSNVVTVNTKMLSPGFYICKMNFGNKVLIQKILKL